MNVVYSAEAVDDLVRLREFIAVHNPQAAHRISNELVSRIEQLCAFPEMGKQIPQFPTPSIRDFIFGNYIVRYAIHSDAITILKIWHHYENRIK
uniref:Plasmid stabilization system n=1 Tax=Chlorobium chlorochromatii (strain CaD3) TaxID=340177 RepID=Q3AT17_CHLCH